MGHSLLPLPLVLATTWTLGPIGFPRSIAVLCWQRHCWLPLLQHAFLLSAAGQKEGKPHLLHILLYISPSLYLHSLSLTHTSPVCIGSSTVSYSPLPSLCLLSLPSFAHLISLPGHPLPLPPYSPSLITIYL